MWGVLGQHSYEQQDTPGVNTLSTFKIEITKALHSSRHRQELSYLLANIHQSGSTNYT